MSFYGSSDRPDFPGGDPGWVEMDPANLIAYTWRDDEHAGLFHAHRNPDGEWCVGSVTFRGFGGGPGRAEWDVLSEDPLTLDPSLLCGRCGDHGWIRDGQWVQA